MTHRAWSCTFETMVLKNKLQDGSFSPQNGPRRGTTAPGGANGQAVVLHCLFFPFLLVLLFIFLCVVLPMCTAHNYTLARCVNERRGRQSYWTGRGTL